MNRTLKLIQWAVLSSLLPLGSISLADCRLPLPKLEEQAFRRIRSLYRNPDPQTGQYPVFPLRDNIFNDFLAWKSTKNKQEFRMHWENFLRPKNDMTYSFFNLFNFSVSAENSLLYICADHNTMTPGSTHVDIYFLTSYLMNPNRLTNEQRSAILSLNTGNLENLPSDFVDNLGRLFRGQFDRLGNRQKLVAVKPVPIQVTGVQQAFEAVDFIDNNIPFLLGILKIGPAVARALGKTLLSLATNLGAGVERIRITPKKIIFYSHVSLNGSEWADTIIKEIPLDSASKLNVGFGEGRDGNSLIGRPRGPRP